MAGYLPAHVNPARERAAGVRDTGAHGLHARHGFAPVRTTVVYNRVLDAA